MVEDSGTPLTLSVDRVLINGDGSAVPPGRALSEHGIQPDILFIREDWWVLGVPEYLVSSIDTLFPTNQWKMVIHLNSR
jgi:hypothetical protein